jgi:CheY-like chemotaxis protein
VATKRIVAVLNDLMFTVKIQDAARKAGIEAVFAKTEEDALRLAREGAAVVIVDLNMNALDPIGLVERLKGDQGARRVTLLGYVSHVQTNVRQAALERGCDQVLPRSAFVQKLPEILASYAAAG